MHSYQASDKAFVKYICRNDVFFTPLVCNNPEIAATIVDGVTRYWHVPFDADRFAGNKFYRSKSIYEAERSTRNQNKPPPPQMRLDESDYGIDLDDATSEEVLRSITLQNSISESGTSDDASKTAKSIGSKHIDKDLAKVKEEYIDAVTSPSITISQKSSSSTNSKDNTRKSAQMNSSVKDGPIGPATKRCEQVKNKACIPHGSGAGVSRNVSQTELRTLFEESHPNTPGSDDLMQELPPKRRITFNRLVSVCAMPEEVYAIECEDSSCDDRDSIDISYNQLKNTSRPHEE